MKVDNLGYERTIAVNMGNKQNTIITEASNMF